MATGAVFKTPNLKLSKPFVSGEFGRIKELLLDKRFSSFKMKQKK